MSSLASAIAGAIEVAGRTAYVTLDMSPGYGYSGIVIAMLAGLNPIGVVAAAIFVAGVLVGADSMSRGVAVPTYIAEVIVAISLLSMLGAGLIPLFVQGTAPRSALLDGFRASGDGELRMTQQQIACHLGTSREVVARLIGELVDSGLVETGRGRIRIRNAPALSALINGQAERSG